MTARLVLLLTVLLAACTGPATVAPTAAPAARSVFYGLDVPHARLDLATSLQRRLGFAPTVLAVFIRYDSTNTAELLARLHGAGLTPFVTLEPWHTGAFAGQPDPADSLASIIDGRHDAELLRQARAVAGYPIYLRFAHEMNAPYYPWGLGVGGNTAAQFVAAWRHVHDLFATVPGLRAQWVFSPVITQAPHARAGLAALYPGDRYVDLLGLTGYEHAAGQPAATFGPTLTELRTLSSRPVVLSEIGTDGAAKADWLAGLGPYLLRQRDIAGFVYFDTTPQSTGATGDYALTTATDLSAFASSLRQLGARRTATSP